MAEYEDIRKQLDTLTDALVPELEGIFSTEPDTEPDDDKKAAWKTLKIEFEELKQKDQKLAISQPDFVSALERIRTELQELGF